MTPITSRSNALVQLAKKLGSSARHRREQGLALIEGVHLAREFLASGAVASHWMISQSGFSHPEILQLLRQYPHLKPMVFTDALLAHCSTVEEPQGIAAIIPMPTAPVPSVFDGSCLVLEAIQDPGNLGTLIRSAAASGLNAVFCSDGTAHLWSPKVLRAAQGAHFKIKTYEGVELLPWLARYQGQAVAATGHATLACFDAHLKGNVAFLVGNEGSGLSPAVLEKASLQVRIPMENGVESLNAAVAGSVLMFERLRQSRF
jgi:TrmH family RNA methyltransferase